MALTEVQQERRRAWFRDHWEHGVAFNRHLGVSVDRWDAEEVVFTLGYRDDLSAHDGVFHGGVISSLIDIAGTAAVAAGHDFDKGSRITTVALSIQFIALDPGQAVSASARCSRRGRQLHYVEVQVRSVTGTHVAQGLVTVQTSGERRGLEDIDKEG